jgi:hypothetical protein
MQKGGGTPNSGEETPLCESDIDQVNENWTKWMKSWGDLRWKKPCSSFPVRAWCEWCNGWMDEHQKAEATTVGEETRDSERVRLSEPELDEVDESMVSTAVEKARLVLCEARVPQQQ